MRHVTDILVAYLDRQLGHSEMDRVSQHLAQCDSCRAQFEAMQSVHRELSTLIPRVTRDIHLPERGWRDIRQALHGIGMVHQRKEQQMARQKPSNSSRLMVGIAITITALIAIVFVGILISDRFSGQASAPTSLPPTVTPTAIPQGLIDELDTAVADLARQDLFSGSVLIGSRGSVLLSQGYGLADRQQKIPNTPQTRFRIGGITEQFTATAVLILASQGKLSTEDPVCNYIADCPDAWKTITIHHLLTHTAGIPEYLRLRAYLDAPASPTTPEPIITRIKDLPLDSQPGEKWSPSYSDYAVLGYIIEQVSGQSYEDFLQQSIFTPLNLHDTGYDYNPGDLAVGYKDRYSDLPADATDVSILYAGGALYSTVEDLYRWEQALATEQLVPKAYLDEMFAPQVPAQPSSGSYGYGSLIGTDRGRLFIGSSGAISGFTAAVARFPNEQIVIVVLSNEESPGAGGVYGTLSTRIFGE